MKKVKQPKIERFYRLLKWCPCGGRELFIEPNNHYIVCLKCHRDVMIEVLNKNALREDLGLK